MPVIGELATLVTAKTAPFERGMRKSRRETKDTAGVMRSLGSKMPQMIGAPMMALASGPMAAVAAGAATVAVGFLKAKQAAEAFVGQVKEQFVEIDRIAKAAATLDIDASVFAALERGADRAGVSMSQLETGLQAFSKRIGEVATLGTGEAKKGLDALGLSAAELLRLPFDKRLAIVADRLGSMETQSERAAVAATLFGRAGQGPLLNFLNQGGDSIRAMRGELERLGVSFDSVEAAKVEAANDAIADLKLSLTGFARSAAIVVAPAIKELADKGTDFVSSVGGGRTLFIGMANAAADFGVVMAKVLDTIKPVFARMASLVFKFTAALTDSMARMMQLADQAKTAFGQKAIFGPEAVAQMRELANTQRTAGMVVQAAGNVSITTVAEAIRDATRKLGTREFGPIDRKAGAGLAGVAERLEIEGLRSAISGGIVKAVGTGVGGLAKIGQGIASVTDMAGKGLADVMEQVKPGATPEPRFAAAIQAGSAEAFSLFANNAADVKPAQDKQVKLLGDAVQKLAQLVGITQEKQQPQIVQAF